MVLAVATGLPYAYAGQAQTAKPGGVDALQQFSTSLQNLSQRVSRSVVQVFSTGYGLADDSDSSESNVVVKQQSTGTGVVLSADGYIITNAHVVQGARSIRVALFPGAQQQSGKNQRASRSGKLMDAKLVGLDRDSDLAVLKIDSTGLLPLTFGDSNDLKQGQLVLAFGNPLGLQNSVSMGVVSSAARQLSEDSSMVYIQTDAPINPGNSGGPLVDTDGHVMGINTMIMSQSGGSEGIGFAIPSNIVRHVFEQICKYGHVHRGEIGIYAQTITPVLAAGWKLPQDWGVLVGDVDPDGPAEKAGVKIGDIVLSIDGTVLEDARRLKVDLYRHAVGEKVKLQLLRGSEKVAVEVPVLEEEGDPHRFADMVDPEKNLVPKLGILGVEITQNMASMLPDLRAPFGVVVAARSADTPYSGGDLQPGDVIFGLNAAPIRTIDELRTATDALKPGDPVVLQIQREDRLMFVAFELE